MPFLMRKWLAFKRSDRCCHNLPSDNRLVTQLLIDGEEPDLALISMLRRQRLSDHTVYIETAAPREMALDVLLEVEQQLQEADRLKCDAIDLLNRNAVEGALQKLSGCFSTWQHAQESVLKTAQLLRIDPRCFLHYRRAVTLGAMVHEFTDQLRSIKSALENRDYVHLCDILIYEATETNNRCPPSAGCDTRCNRRGEGHYVANGRNPKFRMTND